MSWDILPKSNLQYFLQKLKDKFDGKADADEIKGTQTATGNPITLTDASETYAEGLSVELEPKQDLHGQSAPYVGGAGKNKAKPLTSATTSKGITITPQSDGSVILNGTKTTDDNVIIVTSTIKISANVTYSVSIGNAPSSLDYGLNGFGRRKTITHNADYTSGGIGVYCDIGTVLDNVVIYPQLEEGSTATPYAPWENLCPISGYEGVEVEDVGVNQWDEEYEAGYLDANGIFHADVNYLSSKNFIPVTPNTQYYLYSYTYGSFVVFYFDSNQQLISYENKSKNTTFTTPSNAAYIKFGNSYGEGSAYNHDISINYPSTDHDYHPYQSRTASVTFGQTVYGGKSDFTEGGTRLVKAKITKNTSTMNNSNKYPGWQNSGIKALIGAGYNKYFTDQMMNIGTIFSANTKGNDDLLLLPKDIYDKTQDEWIALAIDVEICVALEIPIILSTPPTDLKLLQDTNNLSTNGTTITLDYIPNNSIGDAVKASEEYTARAVEGKADNTTAYVDLPGNYDTTNKNFPTRSATSGSVENCLTYINDLADKLYTAINSHATALANIPTKTVVVNHRAIDVGDDFNISLPLSYKFLIIELTIILTDELCYGSIVSTDFANGSVLSIVANGHGLSYWCDISRMANTITVDGNFDSAHGELTITAF